MSPMPVPNIPSCKGTEVNLSLAIIQIIHYTCDTLQCNRTLLKQAIAATCHVCRNPVIAGPADWHWVLCTRAQPQSYGLCYHLAEADRLTHKSVRTPKGGLGVSPSHGGLHWYLLMAKWPMGKVGGYVCRHLYVWGSHGPAENPYANLGAATTAIENTQSWYAVADPCFLERGGANCAHALPEGAPAVTP